MDATATAHAYDGPSVLKSRAQAKDSQRSEPTGTQGSSVPAGTAGEIVAADVEAENDEDLEATSLASKLLAITKAGPLLPLASPLTNRVYKRLAPLVAKLMNEAARLEEAAAVAKTPEAQQLALVAQRLLFAAPSLVLHCEGSQRAGRHKENPTEAWISRGWPLARVGHSVWPLPAGGHLRIEH